MIAVEYSKNGLVLIADLKPEMFTTKAKFVCSDLVNVRTGFHLRRNEPAKRFHLVTSVKQICYVSTQLFLFFFILLTKKEYICMDKIIRKTN